ncbi:SAM-dependent methyltransferase [Sulfuriferula thiophila]|uniref:SAM-dependent methyltransferase n=1 Tax=Sulfuriferula thiophila TaxID=1781211 RepID=UPI000F605678|nr:SAM-dependent methyltransferase [Sulfuriferula thiophila]
MPDYYDAAQRHWDDANQLFSQDRLPNADQLFGLSAECALKAIMLPLGMLMTNGKPMDRRHGHVNVLWDEFITFANGKGQARYAAALGTTNPFINWNVKDRYENTTVVDAQVVTDHRNAAELAYGCLAQAIVDGVV